MPERKRTDAEEAQVMGPYPSAYHAVGDPEANAMMAKASLVHALMKEIERRGLTQTEAAQLLGIPRPNLSRLCSGQFRSVTFDKLFLLLNKLGRGIRVTTFPADAASVQVDA